MMSSTLQDMSTKVFDHATMAITCGDAVASRFLANTASGDPTSEPDKKAIAEAMFKWATELGAYGYAHWFFPMRGGSGAPAGSIGALKEDAFVDLDWSSKLPIKPFEAAFPPERLFVGETDGSSFPNGGLRMTHRAAAFTTWDRSSPVFVYDNVMRIPCAFVTHNGDSIDEKIPLLRSIDAVNREGLRLLSNIGLEQDAAVIHSYLGWEQEFFVIDAQKFKDRPDLLNCGRTLIGANPGRGQQMSLNYFGPIPERVKNLLNICTAKMLEMGVPMNVAHNEVAPGQHEMCPIYSLANASADSNVLFMEVAKREALKLGLQVLFHEKPFDGINGSGKHANWSVGTDTGVNFFSPGKTDEHSELFVTAVSCLAYGIATHGELLRNAVACAGNDFRLGAQEAPPAIISLYPGTRFEEHVDAIISGGPLVGYEDTKGSADLKSRSAMPATCNAEDRNRTAPFPFCGNRFEFRAVGSSQNCSFPVAMCNTIMAAGMAKLSEMIEAGTTHRDAVATLLKDSRHVIFTGDGYSAEWSVEAERRGLPNLRNTVEAIAQFATPKNLQLFDAMGVLNESECAGRLEMMYENYNSTITIEANTMIHMIDTGMLPACVKDLDIYHDNIELAGDRPSVYRSLAAANQNLKDLVNALPGEQESDDSTDYYPCSPPHSPLTQRKTAHLHNALASYLAYTIKPQMAVVRGFADQAENLMEKSLYPYPTYESLVYGHHH